MFPNSDEREGSQARQGLDPYVGFFLFSTFFKKLIELFFSISYTRKIWFDTGSDDFQLRVFNYNTHEKVAAFEAHPDYIRCLTVHPTASIVLTESDDMTIKAWDWDKAWKNIQVSARISVSKILFTKLYEQTYEGHTHYIMNLAFNPKDANTFMSACLDRTGGLYTPPRIPRGVRAESED